MDDASVRGRDEIGLPTFNLFQQRQTAAAATWLRSESSHVSSPISYDRHSARIQIRHNNLAHRIWTEILDLNDYTFSGNVQATVRAFVRNQTGITRAVFDRDFHAKNLFDGLALKIKQWLGGSKNNLQAPRRPSLRLSEISRQQIKSARIAVDLHRLVADDKIAVTREAGLSHVESRE